MKTITICVLAAVMLTSPAAAIDGNMVCKASGDLAEVIMRHRQDGTAISTLMEAVGDLKIPGTKDLIENVIVGAYQTPRFFSDESQKRAIQDFRNGIEGMCYEMQIAK